MTEQEWAEYRRRVELREARRREVNKMIGFSDFPGWGRSRRSKYQLCHPEFGGQVAPAVAQHGHVR